MSTGSYTSTSRLKTLRTFRVLKGRGGSVFSARHAERPRLAAHGLQECFLVGRVLRNITFLKGQTHITQGCATKMCCWRRSKWLQAKSSILKNRLTSRLRSGVAHSTFTSGIFDAILRFTKVTFAPFKVEMKSTAVESKDRQLVRMEPIMLMTR